MQHRTTHRASTVARPALALGALAAIVAALVAGPVVFHAASATAPASAVKEKTDPFYGCVAEPMGRPVPPWCRDDIG